MPLRLALAAVLLTAAAPVVAFAEPAQTQPVCTLRYRDETVAGTVTYRHPYLIC